LKSIFLFLTHLVLSIGVRVRQKWRPILIGLVLTFAFAAHAGEFINMPGLQAIERQLYDARVRATMTQEKDDRIVILDIDEESLGEFGRWPWNYIRMATIIDRLIDEYGVAAIGFDVVWAESESAQLQSLQNEISARYNDGRKMNVPDTDSYLAKSMSGKPVILGYYFNNGDTKTNSLPPPILTRDQLPDKTSMAPAWKGYTGNIAPLAAAASGAGQINALPDDDGLIRRVPMIMRHGSGYYEGLSLALLRTMFGGIPVEPLFGEAEGYKQVEALKVGPLTLPVDRELAALVTYKGPQRTFDYVSLGDILAGRADPARLSGRIALIGASAPGLSDIRATPTDPIMPGVEVHANMIAAALDQSIRQRPAYATGLDVSQVLLFGILAALLLPMLGAFSGTLVTLGLGSAMLWLNLDLWNTDLLVIPLATSATLLVALYLFNMAWGFLIEGRSKRQLGAMFGQYVPPDLVKEMARDPGRYTMENKDAELTVLFADVRGFTTISEALTAKELAEYINEYLTRMSAIIADGKGTLDKFIGDAIMAFWGAPIEDSNHARNGILVAIAMRNEQKKLSADFQAKGWPPIDIGIGVNSGAMRVGNMGSEHRLAYTVMGDAVNLGARLEGLTKNYGVGIIIGESTRAAVPDIACRLLDRVRVKGKAAAVDIFEPIAEFSNLDAAQIQELQNWERMMAAYFSQNWKEAGARLADAQLLGTPPFLLRLFADRIADLMAVKLPSDWDGVTEFKTK
jgi:adenylate cyclase